MKHFKIIILILLALSINLNSMQPIDNQSIFFVPADPQKTFHQASHQDLLTIEDENSLSDEGTITSLVLHPEKNKRKLVSTLQLDSNGAQGDFIPDNCIPRELYGVTVIRADVSQALGGAHIPGDNIHVHGLRMGKSYLWDGDILAIKNPKTDSIKALLLKTFVPHYACYKIKARCGDLAFDCMHAEGVFENDRKINGLHHRLRGIRLAVLQEGCIDRGDHITILKGTEKDNFIAEHQMIDKYNHLMEISKDEAAKLEKEEAAKAAIRKKHHIAQILSDK